MTLLAVAVPNSVMLLDRPFATWREGRGTSYSFAPTRRRRLEDILLPHLLLLRSSMQQHCNTCGAAAAAALSLSLPSFGGLLRSRARAPERVQSRLPVHASLLPPSPPSSTNYLVRRDRPLARSKSLGLLCDCFPPPPPPTPPPDERVSERASEAT